MVNSGCYYQQQWIVAEPNRSETWQFNKLLIVLVGLWWLVVASAFCLLGAWVIFPFAGLELGAFAVGLYCVCWKLNTRHVIRYDGGQFRIEKGVYRPRRCWRVCSSRLSISVVRPLHPWDPIKIFLCSPDRTIPFGDFLNKQDSEVLLQSLKAFGIAVRNDSVPVEASF